MRIKENRAIEVENKDLWRIVKWWMSLEDWELLKDIMMESSR
jgi:hypothetical protein